MRRTRWASAMCAAACLVGTLARADAPSPPAPPAPQAPGTNDQPRAHDDYREPGRFGVVGAVTDDGFQFGATRIGESYEVVGTLDASFAILGSSTAISGGEGDLGATLRAGPRFSLGHLNYLSAGVQGHASLLGKDNGVSTFGSFSAGPYVGVHRNFAGTPLMISLWVLPYEFSHALVNDGTGKQVALDQHRFFQAGGFGLSYLF